MDYFGGLRFYHYSHIPRCAVWIDRIIPNYWALNFCAAGAIDWITEGGRRISLAGPVAWWTWPGARFRYGCTGGNHWDHYYVTFNGPRARRMMQSSLLPVRPAPYTQLPDTESYRNAWESLFARLDANGNQCPQAVHQLEGLIIALHQPAPTLVESQLRKNLRILTDAIRQAPDQDWNFSNEALKAGLSYIHFRRQFRAIYGVAPHQFVLQSRLEAASRHLRHSDTPIKRIAEIVGIPDVYYFSKLFKDRYHQPPGLYRRESRLYLSTPAP
jgi:AraC-like DNA-binding protein